MSGKVTIQQITAKGQAKVKAIQGKNINIIRVSAPKIPAQPVQAFRPPVYIPQPTFITQPGMGQPGVGQPAISQPGVPSLPPNVASIPLGRPIYESTRF
jgi:hypothetical protein